MSNDMEHRARLWGVIHYRDPEMAYLNTSLVHDAGFYGIALIDMDGITQPAKLVERAQSIKARFSSLRVGVNLLQCDGHTSTTMSIAAGLDATWVDDAGVRAGYWQDGVTPSNWLNLAKAAPEHRVFAGVGFKHTSHDSDRLASARTVAAAGMTVTTSGQATGSAPSIDRVCAMRGAVGASPLAIASGVTPENIASFAPHVSDIFVATGISGSFYEFNEDLVYDLVDALEEVTDA